MKHWEVGEPTGQQTWVLLFKATEGEPAKETTLNKQWRKGAGQPHPALAKGPPSLYAHTLRSRWTKANQSLAHSTHRLKAGLNGGQLA